MLYRVRGLHAAQALNAGSEARLLMPTGPAA